MKLLYKQNGKFQFWLKYTYCFLFYLILTMGAYTPSKDSLKGGFMVG